MDFSIREFCERDIPELARIYVEAYTNSVWCETWKYEDALQRIRELTASPCIRTMICERNDQSIIGCIICELLTWHTGKQIEIKEVFVSSEFRGQGVGTNLIKRIESIGKDEGVTELYLWTNNCRELKDFYLGLGFSTCKDVIQLIKR